MTTHATVIPHSKPWITEDDRRSVDKVLCGGMVAQGELVADFEKSVCEYLKLESGVATASGTAALVLALQVLGVDSNAEIILPTYVCRSVLEAVISVGAVPVICDVGSSWVMTAAEIEPLISNKTALIIAVHIFGRPVDIRSLQVFGVPVLEDACQAFGVMIDGTAAGGLGDIGLLSFHATKCLTTGEGGMLVSNNASLMTEARKKRDGTAPLAPRVSAPLSDLQAALGLAQLARYDHFLKCRCALKTKYIKALKGNIAAELPYADIDFLFRFTIRIETSFKTMQGKMAKYNIHLRRGVDQLLHREINLPDKNYPNAVKAFKQTVSIPFYPALSDDESDAVIKALIETCK